MVLKKYLVGWKEGQKHGNNNDTRVKHKEAQSKQTRLVDGIGELHTAGPVPGNGLYALEPLTLSVGTQQGEAKFCYPQCVP